MSVTLTIPGIPAPQGSKSAIIRNGHARIIEGATTGQRQRHTAWRTAVATLALQATHQHGQLTGPLTVTVTFRHPMPASRPARTRQAGTAWKTTAPDLDKLLRSTLDGLADGGLIANDAHITHITAAKVEVTGWTGATLTITTAGDPPT